MDRKVQGVVHGWRRKTKRGEIHLDTGERFPFTFDMVTNADEPRHIRNNMQVSAVVENDRVRSVTIEGLPQNIPQPLDKPHPGKFLNPYNFVRYLEDPERKPTPDDPDKLVLWRCPPPPHDRYVGFTGRITCRVVATTPLFVSDSHAIRETPVKNDDGSVRVDSYGNPVMHRIYRFFSILDDNGKLKPAIPASSLRGMIRSVYEAATNSCFGVFDGNRKLEFRERPEFGNRVKEHAGIIRRLATEEQPGEVQLCQIAKIGAYYTGNKDSQNARSSRGNGVRGWENGDYVVARAWRTPKGRRIIREFAENKGELQACSDDEEYVYGWLKKTGRGEGTQKLSETLFLDPEKHGSGKRLTFSYEQQEEYNTILRGQAERGQTPVPLKSKKLAVGDLVWLDLEHAGDSVHRIVRVQIPRTPYAESLNEFLPDHLQTCREYDALCPACRAFGWVYQKMQGEEIAENKIVAYAGRIRFSHATIEEEKGRFQDMTLAIFSSPKPTAAEFYLFDEQGQPDATVSYEAPHAYLRGRKFYHHHTSPNSQEYIRAPFENPKRDHQNRTVSGALQAGSTFVFTLDFENLAPVELGALLYALELEDGMFHRLGYAKPLGFGSVRITVEKVDILDWEARLQSPEPEVGWETVEQAQRGRYKQDFIQAMESLYGDDFENVVLGDLRALLGAPPELPIHYPRTGEKPDVTGKNFEWFVGNKKRGREAFPLPLAQDDKQGLPLLNKEGQEVT